MLRTLEFELALMGERQREVAPRSQEGIRVKACGRAASTNRCGQAWLFARPRVWYQLEQGRGTVCAGPLCVPEPGR